MLFFLVLWVMFFWLHAASGAIVDVAASVVGIALGVAMFAVSMWPLFVVEHVRVVGDDVVLETSVCGAPFGGVRRVRKLDIVRVGLDRIVFYRWCLEHGRIRSRQEGWAVTLHSRSAPTERTRLPLREKDGEALLNFLRGTLGHD